MALSVLRQSALLGKSKINLKTSLDANCREHLFPCGCAPGACRPRRIRLRMAEMRSTCPCGIQAGPSPNLPPPPPLLMQRSASATTNSSLPRFGGRRTFVRFLNADKMTAHFVRQLPNDSLNLRQPIHITSLSYLSSPSSKSYAHIATGTLLGDVRRYDTRAARKPVANWKSIGKNGGVSVVQSGRGEKCVRHIISVSASNSLESVNYMSLTIVQI